jgi:hypothetical protein
MARFTTPKPCSGPHILCRSFCPPDSPARTPIAQLWRDLKDQLADGMPQTLQELSDTVCALMQNDSPAALQSLTSCAYFVPAVAYAQSAIYV